MMALQMASSLRMAWEALLDFSLGANAGPGISWACGRPQRPLGQLCQAAVVIFKEIGNWGEM